jgi:hypothetical protein
VYKKYAKYKSNYNDYSYMRNTSRIKKDLCLRDDVEFYIAKSGNNLSNLVDMLLNNHFEHSRYTDPEYPV